MSLQVWLPLNGTLENKGVANITTTSTPTYLDGKFGKGVSLTPRVDFSNLPKLNKFSIFFWTKVDSCSVDWADVIGFTSKQKDDASASAFRFEATKTSRACSFHNNSPFAITSATRILITETQKGTWHNVGVTYDGKTICSYIDGVKTYTDDGLEGYLINTFHIGETNNMVGVMNDLRIYDNVLSLEQIKEISRGLVLHYPLNSGYGNENLIKSQGLGKSADADTTVSYDAATDTYTINASAGSNNWGNGLYIIKNKNFSVPYGKAYRVSAEVFVPTTHKIQIDINNDVASGTAWGGNDNDNGSKRVGQEFTIQPNMWKKIEFGSENSNTKNTEKIDILPYDKIGLVTTNDTEPTTWYIRRIKGEISDKTTPWVPSSEDASYSRLGYGNNIEYDTSGLGTDGNVLPNATYSNDSPLYDSCRTFNGIDQKIEITNDVPFGRDCFSFSVWIKADKYIQNSKFLKINNAQRSQYFNFGATSSSTPEIQFMTFDNSTTGTKWYSITANEFPLNQWIHWVGTCDGTTQKLYKNGELFKSAGIQSRTQTIGTGSKIGMGTTVYSSCKMSDLRIYSSVLSANDIKELYQTKAKIDKNGNLYCNEFIDNDYDEELLTSQSLNFSQATGGEANIERETIGKEIINKITFGDTFTSWKYLSNNTFPKDKILNQNLLLTFKYKVDSVINGDVGVRFCSGAAQAPQPISVGTFIPTTEWQEYVGIIEMGAEYASQVVYIRPVDSLKSNTLYIKDLSLKLVGNKYNISLSKKSIMNSKIIEEVSDNTSVKKNKNGVIIAKEVIEI